MYIGCRSIDLMPHPSTSLHGNFGIATKCSCASLDTCFRHCRTAVSTRVQAKKPEEQQPAAAADVNISSSSSHSSNGQGSARQQRQLGQHEGPRVPGCQAQHVQAAAVHHIWHHKL